MPLPNLPPFQDEEIRSVCKILDLPENAFHGSDGTDPRAAVIKNMGTLDIEACPGSGKTTLLVAKLSLTAKHWPSRTRGICVLSHTNAAREEIEKQLGNTPEGQALLKYPHYVGTIHGFVNEFLALPWLRSTGYNPNIIDDDIVLNWRWSKLSYNIRAALEQNHHSRSLLKVENTSFSLGNVSWGRGSLGQATPTYTSLVECCKESIDLGYFCFEEMFVWAKNLLEKKPEVQSALRHRFPFLFIDEVQDNSEAQSNLLNKIFCEGSDPVVRQRFGDSNQAIFNNTVQKVGATTDPFPSNASGVLRILPNSHRFGSEIADLANPFGINPLPDGLKGQGPNTKRARTDTSGKHTIFLFAEGEIEKVLPAYAEHILNVFGNDSLALTKGDFVAVGAVHKVPDNPKAPPHHVGDYHSDYNSELSRKDPVAKSFAEYIIVGMKRRQETKASHHIIEKCAEALLRACTLLGGSAQMLRRRRKHNYIIDQLSGNVQASSAYKDLVQLIVSEPIDLSQQQWDDVWLPHIVDIVSALGGDMSKMDDAVDFLTLPVAAPPPQTDKETGIANSYTYSNAEGAEIRVRLGSIHSVKGQTHTATLVLDTFLWGRNGKTNLTYLEEWIQAKKVGQIREGVQNIARLKLHFVAMTRPTHLLCLAMRADSFTETEIQHLKDNTHWSVKKL